MQDASFERCRAEESIEDIRGTEKARSKMGRARHVQRVIITVPGYQSMMSSCAHAMDQPPSIGRVAPVMSCAASLHRKTAIAPTASMAINRPVGWRAAR